MLGQSAIGGIVNTGQSTAQALTSGTAAKLLFTGASNISGTGSMGDPAVKPDAPNSQIQVNAPGLYKVRLEIYGNADGAMNVTADIRKTNNAGSQVAVTGARGIALFTTTNKYQLVMEALVQVNLSDLPTAGGQKTFADPSAAVGAYKPNGGFAGAGAAPATGVLIDVAVTGDASQSLTLTDQRLTIERVG